jgi:hypothetical protein
MLDASWFAEQVVLIELLANQQMALARNLVKSAFSISLSCLIHENIDNVDGLESQIGTN